MMGELENTARLVLNGLKTEDTARIKTNIAYLFLKRTFDVFASFFGLIFLIPVIVFVKIANMINGDFGKVIYTQNRIGKDGHEFKFYKFRSMCPNADEVLKDLLKNNPELAKEYKINKKLSNDPRITKVGNFIRKTSIDELPQLINIFLGDMSFIGNRPYLPREKKDMGSYYEDIIKTKPGLTGFWQCSLRSEGTFEERLKMEKYYSNNMGLRFDISIFIKTIESVLLRKGAK